MMTDYFELATNLARVQAESLGVRVDQPEPFHTCSCGATYTKDEWLRLQYVGVQEDECDPLLDLELRNCTCGSTRAVFMVEEASDD